MKYADTPPRKNVGEVDFPCSNCGKEHHRTLWQEQDEDFGLVHADALCSCGARLLLADNLQEFAVYWLNEKEMKRSILFHAKNTKGFLQSDF